VCVCMHTHMHTHTHTHVCTYTHARAHTHTHTHTYSACNSGSQNASDKDNIQSTASTPARTGRTPGKSVCVCVCVSVCVCVCPRASLSLFPLSPPLPITSPSPSQVEKCSRAPSHTEMLCLAYHQSPAHLSRTSLTLWSIVHVSVSLSLSLPLSPSLSLCGAARHSLIHRYGVDWHAGRAPCSTAPAAPARRRRRKRKQVRGEGEGGAGRSVHGQFSSAGGVCQETSMHVHGREYQGEDVQVRLPGGRARAYSRRDS